MTDNIKPEHYRKGEIDLYEAFSQIFPHNEYRAGMQMIAMRYMFRDKIDRVEDIDKAMETMKRWKEKEIEHREAQLLSKDETIDNAFDFIRKHENKERVSLLKNLLNKGFEYVARDKGGVLCAYDGLPLKADELGYWDIYIDFDYENIRNDNFPEVKWTDDEPTKISNLLATYENGGENGKVED